MANFIKRTGATALDIFGNVISGAGKSIEGIWDIGAGVVGAVGGIFDKDFQKDVQRHIEKDHTDAFMNDVLDFDEWTKDSYTNDGKVGQMVEGVASGLGQMLPTLALTAVTGGAAAALGASAKAIGAAKTAASVGTLWASAAGNATEEAYKDGADYEKGMLYGAASGAVEAGTEKLFGGVTKNVIGGGILDDVGKSIVGEIGEVGIKRVAKDALGEGIEEIAAEVANPALKSIYKGKGAFAEYGDKEYWQGVGEAGTIGAGTSLAYGGTVGKIAKTSGKYADVESSLEANRSIDEKLQSLDVEGKLTSDVESMAAKSRLTNLAQIETALKSANENQRADIIKRNNLSGVFEDDGSLKESIGAELNRRISKADSGIRNEYYTVNARGKENIISEDLEKISAKLNAGQSITASREGTGAPKSAVRVFSGELSNTGRESLTKTKKALNALNERAGSDVSLIVTEDIPGTNGIMVGDRMYVTRNAIESGKYAETLVHEYMHFEEGSEEYVKLVNLLQSDVNAFTDAISSVLSGSYGITSEQYDAILEKMVRGEKLTDREFKINDTVVTETAAKMSEKLLGTESFINKLVKTNGSLAEKIVVKIQSLIETLSKLGDKEAMSQLRRLRNAEKLYLKAAEAAGNRKLIRMLGGDNEHESTQTAENGEKTPLTCINNENMHVSGDVVHFSKDVYDPETAGIKDQIRNASEKLNSMESVYIGKVPDRFDSKSDAKKWAAIELKKYGYKVDRQNFGTIEFAQKDIYGAIEHLTSSEEISSIVAVPRVMKRGIEIGEHGNHKLRQKHTVTFAAPVELNNSRGNMAVVVNMKNKKYYVHRVLLPDGSAFKFNKNENANQEMYQGVPQGSLANTTRSAFDISIPDSPEKVNTSDEKIQFSHSDNDIAPRITVGMSEDERAKILQHLTLQPQEIIIPEKFDIDFEQLERSRKSEISSTLIQKLRDLGCLKAYQTSSVDVQFEFTGGGLRKSMNSQVYDYGGTLGDLAKVILNMQTLLDNAVLLEIHTDKAAGAEQENKRLKNTYVLLSAFAEGKNITPVQFEIKQYVDENNRLYLAVALTKIETSVVGDTVLDEQGRTRLLPVSAISIPQLVEKINPRDKNFFKYIPDSFLSNEQLAAKKRALNEENKKYGRSEIQFSRETADVNPKNNITITRGEAKKRDANYKSDKVYSKGEAEAMIASLTVLESLPPKLRKSFTEELWYALNSEFSDDKRKFRVSLIAKRIMNALYENAYSPEDTARIRKLESEIRALRERIEKAKLQETKDKLTKEIKPLKAELSGLKENHIYKDYPTEAIQEIENEIESSLFELVEKGGEPSIRAKLESEFDKTTAGKWKAEWKNSEERFQILGRLIEKVHKLDDFKKGRFERASKYRPEVFKDTIEQLTKINFRGNLNVQGTRRILKELGDWYNTENELFVKMTGGEENYTDKPALLYDEHIANCIKEVGDGKGPITNEELEKIEQVISYLLHIEKTYQAVLKNGQYIDAIPENKVMREIANQRPALRRGVFQKYMESWYNENFGDLRAICGNYDTFDEGGFHTTTLNEITEAEIQKQKFVNRFISMFDAFKEKHKDYAKESKKRTVKYNGVEMSIANARSLYMSLKDPDLALALVESDNSIYDKEKKIAIMKGLDVDTIAKLRASGASKAEIKKAATAIAHKKAQELYKLFNDADKEFISIIEKIYNVEGRKEKINADVISQGYSRLKENGPYHYPAVRKGVVFEVGGFEIDDKGRAASFNKHRVDSNSPLFILPDIDMVERYINGLANYACVSPVLRNFKTRLHLDMSNTPTRPDTLLEIMKNEFSNANVAKRKGESNKTALELFYSHLFEDVQGRRRDRKSEIEDMLRGNAIKAMLAANPKTICNQSASLFAATSILEPKYMLKGLKYAKYKTNEVDKYCDLALIRDADNDIFRAQANVDRNNAVMRNTNTIGDIAMKGIAFMDRKIVQTEWGWAQVQVEAKLGLKLGSEENKVEAGKLLHEVILHTQQNSLVTTKSSAMRSDSGLWRQITTMTSDALRVSGKLIYSIGKVNVLYKKRQMALEAGDTAAVARYDKEIKDGWKQLRKDIAAFVCTAIWTAMITLLFKLLYHRLDDEENTDILQDVALDTVGNMFGAFPIISDAYDYFVSGYGIEDFSMSAFNDLLEAGYEVFNYTGEIKSGTADSRATARTIRKVAYAGGHALGLPIRNVYNVLHSVIGWNEGIRYRVDDLFYKQSYNKDLAKAIKNGDEDMIATITGIITGERIGDIKDDNSRKVLNKLNSAGHSVLPRAIGDTITHDGTEYILDTKMQKKFKAVYAESHEALAELVKLPAFERTDEKTQADAIKRLYNVYYEIARNEVLDTEETKTTLFARVLDAEEIALIVAYASNIKADTDKAGNAITGSKKRKVQKYVESLKLTAAEKYLIMGYLGYKNLYGKDKVTAYLNRYKLTKSEKEQILKACGY